MCVLGPRRGSSPTPHPSAHSGASAPRLVAPPPTSASPLQRGLLLCSLRNRKLTVCSVLTRPCSWLSCSGGWVYFLSSEAILVS